MVLHELEYIHGRYLYTMNILKSYSYKRYVKSRGLYWKIPTTDAFRGIFNQNIKIDVSQ